MFIFAKVHSTKIARQRSKPPFKRSALVLAPCKRIVWVRSDSRYTTDALCSSIDALLQRKNAKKRQWNVSPGLEGVARPERICLYIIRHVQAERFLPTSSRRKNAMTGGLLMQPGRAPCTYVCLTSSISSWWNLPLLMAAGQFLAHLRFSQSRSLGVSEEFSKEC